MKDFSELRSRERDDVQDMSGAIEISDTVLVLAGGLGTRLRATVSDRPKVMAEAAGRPFLAWLLDDLETQGVTDCVLSLGFEAELVLDWLDRRETPPSLRLRPVIEPDRLGTGGAVRFAADRLGLSGNVIVVNGDTWLPGGVRAVSRAWYKTVLAIVNVPDTKRYGRVETDDQGRVTAFREKGIAGAGHINAGVCRLPVGAFQSQPSPAFGLETAVLEPLVARGNLYATAVHGLFIDIGIAEDYARFCQLAANSMSGDRR